MNFPARWKAISKSLFQIYLAENLDWIMKTLRVGSTTNYANISSTGDLTFVGTSGLLFGEIYVKDNVTTMILNSAAKVQITIFTTNGESNGLTPDHSNDHVTVDTAGKYLCAVSTSVNNQASQSHDIAISVWKNNGDTEFTNLHSDRTLTGGSGDFGSVTLNGIIDLAASDTIEVWANTDAAADREVCFQDITLTLIMIGGT